MRKERYQELTPSVEMSPHTPGLSLSSPLPTQVVVPSPRPMDTARAPSSLRGLVQLQPMGPGPISGTSGSPSPSHRLQRQGGWGGERKRREERQLGRGSAEQPRGAGAEKGAGSARRAGGRRGRGRLCGGGGRGGGDKFSGPAVARPLTWVPAQAPRRCLRRSVGPPGRPRASGPRGLGAGARAARAGSGEQERPPPPGVRAGGRGAEPRASERGGERPGGGEEGARRERASRASGGSE